MTPSRRQFLVLGAAIAPARAALRSGALGEVRFVRIEGEPRLVQAVQLVLGESAPRSVTVQRGVYTRTATLRYRRCVVSYEEGAGESSVTFLGARATLRVALGGSNERRMDSQVLHVFPQGH